MIEIEDLTVYYNRFRALNSVSFTAGPGEITGLLGPNGAGKSTIMKCLTTQIIPHQGRICINGVNVTADPVGAKRLVGYMPESPPLYPEMEISEYLDFVGRARGLSAEKLRRRKDWVVERCGLRPVFHKLLSSLSKGYRQRAGLAQCLIHDPEVIILDEPTSGLDPLQILDIRALLRELAEKRTVIFSTHILQEAEALSHNVVMIRDGEVMAAMPLDQLLKPGGGEVLQITVIRHSRKFEELAASLPGMGAWRRVAGDGDEGPASYEFAGHTPGFSLDLSLAMAQKGIAIRRFHEPGPGLEEVFVEMAMAQKPTQAGEILS